jgi:DNA-binding transcriptional MerR regulator
VSGDRIGQWARRGYIVSSRSAQAPRVYSFQDVGEAMVVHELIERGLPPREIRRAVRNLRGEYGDWPLTSAPLAITQLHTGKTRGSELLILAKAKAIAL